MTPTIFEAAAQLARECEDRSRETEKAVETIEKLNSQQPQPDVCGPCHCAIIECLKTLARGQATLLHCRAQDYETLAASSDAPQKKKKSGILEIGNWRIPAAVYWLAFMVVIVLISSGRILEVIEVVAGLLHRK